MSRDKGTLALNEPLTFSGDIDRKLCILVFEFHRPEETMAPAGES